MAIPSGEPVSPRTAWRVATFKSRRASFARKGRISLNSSIWKVFEKHGLLNHVCFLLDFCFQKPTYRPAQYVHAYTEIHARCKKDCKRRIVSLLIWSVCFDYRPCHKWKFLEIWNSPIPGKFINAENMLKRRIFKFINLPLTFGFNAVQRLHLSLLNIIRPLAWHFLKPQLILSTKQA